MTHLRFKLNDSFVEASAISPTTTLLQYLRNDRSLMGTKEGCAEGDCGACTVAIAEREVDGRPVWRAVNSCLVLLPTVHGKQVLTIEGLKSASGELHFVQEALAAANGSQCGYCTPGVVMSMFEAAYRRDLGEPWKLDDQLSGNLCRCTGYRSIADAATRIAGRCPDDRFSRFLSEPLNRSEPLFYESNGQRFSRPTSIDELYRVLDADASARIIAGGTDIGLEVTKRFLKLQSLVSIDGVSELRCLEVRDGRLICGAGVKISELEQFCEKVFPSVHEMVRYFGSRQIKHRATVGGNLCTASPIGDLAPVFLSLGAAIAVGSSKGERLIPIDDFFVAYRKTALNRKEVVLRVEIPLPSPTSQSRSFKVSKRREVDIATVSAGFTVDLDNDGRVRMARLAYGGMAAVPKRADHAEGALVGQSWNASAVEVAAAALAHDFSPQSDHRGSAAHRMLVAQNLLRLFHAESIAR